MTIPNNALQNVATYQRAEIAWLRNSFYAVERTNKRFQNLENLTANLGDSVTFDRGPRYTAFAGLNTTPQPSNQLVQTITCGSSLNVQSTFTDQQFLFNVEEYMRVFGYAAALEMGSYVEADILKNFISANSGNTSGATNYNVVQYQSGPYRFYGDGVTAIDSFQKLAQAVANFMDYGAARNEVHGVLPVNNIPAIVGNGLSQFAINRNNDLAMEWELGSFAKCEWFTSNLLPIQMAGTIGNATAPNNIMTVVSTNDPTGANVTQITFTEPTSSTSTSAIKAGDLFYFVDGVSGQPNMRFLTYNGHQPCAQPVQFRAIADAASVSGTVTVSFQTTNGVGLVWGNNQNRNLNNPIAAGMKVAAIPSHRAGCLHSGQQFYLAMPKLPSMEPWPSSTMQDVDSGVALRHYYGALFGLGQRSYVRDIIWGSTMVAENAMRLCFPM